MAEKHGVGIVGLGGMGSAHAEWLQSISDEITLVGSFDIAEARQEYAKKIGIKPFESLDALLAEPSIDIVLIAVPNNHHCEIATRALKAGKNVICEKPVMMNSAELAQVLKVAEETKKLFVVHQNRRWDEDFNVVKKLYEDGSMGQIYRIESKVHGSRGIPGDWRAQKECGGGMMLDWGVHLLDQILWMVKEKLSTVYCKMTNVRYDEVDDGFSATLTFANGLVVLVEVMTCNFITAPRWYVNSGEGTAVIEDWNLNGKITLLTEFNEKDAKPIVAGAGMTKTMAPRNPDSTVDKPLPKVAVNHRDYYRNVMNAIDGKEEIIVKNCEVMRVMKLMEACFESNEKNQVITFEA